jgi:branched-chain amino acid transport system substrate-binding protein
MKNKVLTGLVVIVVVLIGIGLMATRAEETTQVGQKITIGVIETLSGPAAFYGTETQKGVDLAIDVLQEEYADYSFKVYHQDAEFTPKGAIDAYAALKQAHDLDVLLTQASTVSVAIQPLAHEDELFHVALVTSALAFSTPNDYSFRASAMSIDEAEPMARFMEEQQFERVAVLYFQNELGVSMVASLKEALAAEYPNAEIVIEEGFAPTEQDFRTILTKVKAEDPDAVYVAALGGNIATILNQSQELALDTQFLSFRIAEDPTVLDVAKENANGMVYTYAFDAESKDEMLQDFVRRFEKKYGVMPNGYNAEAYMGTYLVGTAFVECKKDYACIADYLERAEGHKTIFGDVLFDENGDISHEFFLKEVKDGAFLRQ